MGRIVMKTIEERARDYADKHKAESDYFGVEKVYNYERIYNAEITAYERGAKEQKAIDKNIELEKHDNLTQEEYDRLVAFSDWYSKNGKGTPTFSDAIEWSRKQAIKVLNDWLLQNYYFNNYFQHILNKLED